MLADRRLDSRLVAGVLMLLALPLLVLRLGAWPAAWFDEGAYLQGAKNLALYGEYAVQSGGAFYRFDPMLAGAGPTVLLPAAALLRLFGMGLIQGRIASVCYALAAIWVCFHLADRMMGRRAAIVATALMVCSPWGDFCYTGRLAAGQMASLFFVLLGTYCWWRAVDRDSIGWSVGSGAAFGLALLSEQQSVVLVGALLLVGIVDVIRLRRLGFRRWGVPLLVALLFLAAWVGCLIAAGSLSGWLRNLQTQALATLFRPAHILANFNRLASSGYLLWALPAVAYAILQVVRKNGDGFKELVLLAAMGAWLLWYLLGSIGHLQYAFVPMSIGSLLIGRLFGDATDDFRFDVRWIRGALEESGSGSSLARLALGLLPILAIGYGVLVGVDGFLNEGDRSAQQMAAYLDEHVAPGALVETWDWEMAFLSRRAFHLPPFEVLDAITRREQLGAPLAGEPYSPAAWQPDYLIDGPWSWMTRVYGKYIEQHCDLVVVMGPYDLYSCAQ